MHLAVLVTNTDESAFAQAHPKDGEKFTRLIQSVRPNWQVSSYIVKDGIFPDDLSRYDGLMITGSPASVLEQTPWMERLFELIREAHDRRLPMFGACFGHQAIAMALGGEVRRSEDDWAFGLLDMFVSDAPDWFDGPPRFTQFAAHIDHVTQAPDGARILFSTSHCQNAGFALGQHIYTTQNHPEMSPEFAAALVEEYADTLGPEVAARARASLSRKADSELFAQSIARFFEGASGALDH
ncbi:type 1 glutamine amidotransferase [Primorskyibacter sp. S187A]|uniref:type 1 glutamine amidotransferase n=1 Tax=Primorskyibacter sp. S187A TaxID=3415130 RepID=UPI003C7AC23D